MRSWALPTAVRIFPRTERKRNVSHDVRFAAGTSKPGEREEEAGQCSALAFQNTVSLRHGQRAAGQPKASPDEAKTLRRAASHSASPVRPAVTGNEHFHGSINVASHNNLYRKATRNDTSCHRREPGSGFGYKPSSPHHATQLWSPVALSALSGEHRAHQQLGHLAWFSAFPEGCSHRAPEGEWCLSRPPRSLIWTL